MTSAIYVLGGPGSGKSTLTAHILEDGDWALGPYVRLTDREMFGHEMLNGDLERGVYLGKMRPEYPGTDALSLSVAPQALKWLQKLDPQLSWVIGEGARLGHQGFLQELSIKAKLLVVHIRVEPEVAAERRAGRPGKALSAQFCKTVTTTAANTAAWCKEVGIPTLELDGTRPVEELSEDVRFFQ